VLTYKSVKCSLELTPLNEAYAEDEVCWGVGKNFENLFSFD
jgi:hypothetical protein